MNSQILIKSINELLGKPWTKEDLDHGRQIKIPCAWGSDALFQTTKQYRSVGWNIEQAVRTLKGARYYYLRFKNPHADLTLPQEN